METYTLLNHPELCEGQRKAGLSKVAD